MYQTHCQKRPCKLCTFLIISDFGTLYREQSLFFLRISEFFQNVLGNLWKSFWHYWVPHEKYWHPRDEDYCHVCDSQTADRCNGDNITVWLSLCYSRSLVWRKILIPSFWPGTNLLRILHVIQLKAGCS